MSLGRGQVSNSNAPSGRPAVTHLNACQRTRGQRLNPRSDSLMCVRKPRCSSRFRGSRITALSQSRASLTVLGRSAVRTCRPSLHVVLSRNAHMSACPSVAPDRRVVGRLPERQRWSAARDRPGASKGGSACGVPLRLVVKMRRSRRCRGRRPCPPRVRLGTGAAVSRLAALAG